MADSSDAVRGHESAPKGLSDGVRSIISLLIFLHVFCLVVVLLGNQYASGLQMRVIRVLGPYTRLLYLDPQVILGFHLTHAMELEDDHFVSVEFPEGDSVQRYPSSDSGLTGWRGGIRYHRWKMLTRRLAMMAEGQNDQYLAQVCQAVGRNILNDDQDRMVFKVVRRMPIQLRGTSVADEGGPEAFETVYEADVWLTDQGGVAVHKKVDAGEAAPLEAGSR